MDQIRAALENISELSAEELDSLKDSVIAEYNGLDTENLTPETVETMQELAAGIQSVRSEQANRTRAAEELASKAADAKSMIDSLTAEPEAEVEEEAAVEEAATEETEELSAKDEAEVEAPAESEEEAPTEVVASVDNTEELATKGEPDLRKTNGEKVAPARPEDKLDPVVDEVTRPEDHVQEKTDADVEEKTEPVRVETHVTPENEEDDDTNNNDSEDTVTASANIPDFDAPAGHEPKAQAAPAQTIVAAADLKGIPMGTELPDLRSVAAALLDRRKGMKNTSGGDGERALVASITSSYDEAHTLDSHDVESNREKLENTKDAIVAAGGLYAPVETSYKIYGLGEIDDRPVRDALPKFNAERGGIRFLTPPVMADLDGAVSVWTLQDDVDAAEDGSLKEKPCLRVAAGDEVTVYTEAIPLCLTFGNLGARAFPEMVERHLELAKIWHARFAEVRLLTRIGSLSTAVTADAQLGAARDIFVQVDQAAAAMRSRHRLNPNAPLQAIFPNWFRNALRADVTKQLPGDGQDVTFNLSDAVINKWFSSRGISVTWTHDGETGQIFGAQAAGALAGFPASLVWYLFPTGTFIFLDGGTLDLGLVRDSTLNGTNDYKIFLETFEGVAKVGVESLRITSALKIAGASAATANTLGV